MIMMTIEKLFVQCSAALLEMVSGYGILTCHKRLQVYWTEDRWQVDQKTRYYNFPAFVGIDSADHFSLPDILASLQRSDKLGEALFCFLSRNSMALLHFSNLGIYKKKNIFRFRHDACGLLSGKSRHTWWIPETKLLVQSKPYLFWAICRSCLKEFDGLFDNLL